MGIEDATHDSFYDIWVGDAYVYRRIRDEDQDYIASLDDVFEPFINEGISLPRYDTVQWKDRDWLRTERVDGVDVQAILYGRSAVSQAALIDEYQTSVLDAVRAYVTDGEMFPTDIHHGQFMYGSACTDDGLFLVDVEPRLASLGSAGEDLVDTVLSYKHSIKFVDEIGVDVSKSKTAMERLTRAVADERDTFIDTPDAVFEPVLD
jgi:hypothetical protein